MVNVGKYSIHGASGKYTPYEFVLLSFLEDDNPSSYEDIPNKVYTWD